MTAVLILFITLSFTKNEKPRFEEIDVERINIVEKDGQLKLVISNKARQHPGLINGKEIPARERSAGLIFFNEAGDECGGLVHESTPESSDMTYSVDQYRNDQIMQLNYSETRGGQAKRAYGLKLWDRSDEMPLERQLRLKDSAEVKKTLAAQGAFGAERFFAGKTYNNEVGVFIRDSKGNPRIKLYIDAQNNPQLQFLDEKGRPVTQPSSRVSSAGTTKRPG